MGLRIIEKVDTFPGPTPEELQFFQLSFGGPVTDLEQSKVLFKKWILVNGFEDVCKSIRATLERLLIFRTIESTIKENKKLNIEESERELRLEVTRLGFPALIARVNSLFEEKLQYQKEVESFRKARNCLEHAHGTVAKRDCNNPEKDKLIIHGNRFRLFFKKKDEAEVLAEFGKAGPENAALMLGAEEFQIEFRLGQSIELSLKQFIDILNTCVLIRADIELKLKKRSG
jgi:hypothetical protein